MGPASKPEDKDDSHRCSPSNYLKVFQEAGVQLVVRLNSKEYDNIEFMREGIRHMDLYFPDGSCPSREIIERFLTTVQKQPGAVAVHCKAGLGRTGVLIGLYMMLQYSISARSAIG